MQAHPGRFRSFAPLKFSVQGLELLAHRVGVSLVFFFVAGCATFTGAPKPLMSSDKIIEINSRYIQSDVVTPFYASTDSARNGLTKREWRDTVISANLGAIDLRYAEFKEALNRDEASLNLGVDLAVLAAAGLGTVAAKGTANALSAVSTGLVGAGAAFNKDVFYQKTLSALLAAMDTNRKQVLLIIRNSQKGDETVYPLDVAMTDLQQYEAAGTIEGAIGELGVLATTASANADQQLHQAEYQAVLVSDDVSKRKIALNNYVRSLLDPLNKTKLDAIATTLKVAIDPNATTERINITNAINKQVTDEDTMDKISSSLKPTTGKDF